MWSLGCILGELLLGKISIIVTLINDFFLLGKPLFPGTSSFSQINLIMEALPPPTREGKT